MNSTTGGVKNRRKSAIKRLETQLALGKKPMKIPIGFDLGKKRGSKKKHIVSKAVYEPLEPSDIQRITNELLTLKSRV